MARVSSEIGELKNDRALDALAEVVREGAMDRSPAELEDGLHLLSERIAEGRSGWRRPAVVRWAMVGAAMVAALLLGLQLLKGGWRAPLVFAPAAPFYQVEGGSVLEGGYLREAGHAGLRLLFNEGSKFSLQPGTRGRLRSVDRNGARVAIEQGTASFQVTPGTDRRWFVEVGPFLVTVKGTVFTVSWDPSSERFELRLRHGHVVVSGPISGGDITLRTGQRLVVRLPDAESVISEDASKDIAGDAASPPTADEVSPPEAVAPIKDRTPAPDVKPSVASATVKRSVDHRWPRALANGHWDRILADVESSGVEAALAEASSEDLYALANAARYRRRLDLARAALVAERRRFPSSSWALDATFMLGRVEEAQGGDGARAIAWYDEYLSRSPSGPYAAEALGRKMILTSERGAMDAARAIATEYLRRFPAGSYAGSARALRRGP
jgi:TolA-binding protein